MSHPAPVRRDLDTLARRFDLLVLGAGIYGASIARLAALHGLSVALIDRGDFGGATSRNSAKLVHGGLRYVQHLDLSRMRESAAAQRLWRTAAPHLVRPLQFVIPTYGAGTRGPAALAAGIAAYELATADRNRGVARALRLPRAGVLSRRRLLRRYPVLERRDVSGGAWWYDAQMLDATRLTLECVLDAHRAGAAVANHVEALGLLTARERVCGAALRDRLSGRELEVQASVTVNCAGPWIERLARTARPRPLATAWPPLTRNVNLVTRRLFAGESGIGVSSRRPSDALIGRSQRLFFVTPWQDCSIIGTWHDRYAGDPDAVSVGRHEIEAWLAEIGDALPGVRLGPADLRSIHVGLTPGSEDDARAHRASIIDHAETDRLAGLLSVAGPKYTTAPTVAARVLEHVHRRLSRPRPARERFAAALPGAPRPAAGGGPAHPLAHEPAMAWALRIYGSQSGELLGALPTRGLEPAEHVFRCRIVHGVRTEMVVTLADALFRATDHAERGALTAAQLEWCADTLAQAFDWSAARRAAELERVQSRLAAASISLVVPRMERDRGSLAVSATGR